MKGATSFDGKMSGNVQTVGRYDESKKPAGGEDIHSVVAKHGPADRHVITKTAKGFHSETSHGGHIHHADHATLDEAHQYGKVAMEDAEHNTMGEDAMSNAGERGAAEKPMGGKSYMD